MVKQATEKVYRCREGDIQEREMKAADRCLSPLLPPFIVIDRAAGLNGYLPAVLR